VRDEPVAPELNRQRYFQGSPEYLRTPINWAVEPKLGRRPDLASEKSQLSFFLRTTLMATKSKQLLSQTAADLMIPGVVAIPQNATLWEAAQLLKEQGISGLPVVDKAGGCVGVLSGADFVRLWVRADSRESLVREHMTPDPVTAGPHTPIVMLARMMIDAHIHRIIVTDGEGRPIGVVSSTDVLAALVYKGGSP
jgi:CBS domain-containing protein